MKELLKKVNKQNLTEILAGVFIIIQKNIKLLLRTRASTLIIILGPLLLVFFAGIAFDNTNLYSVKIGTYSASYNALTNSFIEKLHEKQFKTKQYSSEETCTEGIKKGEINACIVFAPDFKLAQNKSNEITFYLDYSKLNLVWTITSVMSEQISLRSKELSMNLTAEVMRALDFTKSQVQKRRQTLIGLTTQNDEASRRIYDISSQLEELDLQLDPGQIGITNLSLQKNKVQHWVENSVTLGDSALQQSLQYISAIDDLVKASSASVDLKNSVHDYLKTTVGDISTLKERMQTTKNILGQESTDFDALINSIINSFSRTKTKIDTASTAKGFTIEQLNVIKTLLDKALINILEVQKSLNEIEKAVSNVQVTEPSSIVQPIVTTIKPIIAEKSYLNYLFPTLITLVIMYTAMLLMPILILLERNSPAYFRNFMTPTKDHTFIISTFATGAMLVGVQSLIILFVTAIFFSSQIFSSLFITLLICLLIIIMFTFAGMFIGYVFDSEETAILASTFTATGFLFLSDVIFPIESMSSWLGAIAWYNPFVVATTLLRKTIVFNATIGAFWQELFMLIFYCIFAGALAVGVYYALKKHNLAKYISQIAPTKQTVLSRINPKIIRIIMRK